MILSMLYVTKRCSIPDRVTDMERHENKQKDAQRKHAPCACVFEFEFGYCVCCARACVCAFLASVHACVHALIPACFK